MSRESVEYGYLLGICGKALPMVGSGEAEENGGGSENIGAVPESE